MKQCILDQSNASGGRDSVPDPAGALPLDPAGGNDFPRTPSIGAPGRLRFGVVFLGALCLLCCFGCAARQPLVPAQKIENPQRLRHAVTLTVDGHAPLTFTGLMERDAPAGRIRAVALQGMGLTLFDMTVDKNGYALHRAHPSFAKIPGAMDAAAASIRRLFLDCAPGAGPDAQACPDVTASPGPGGGPGILTLREKHYTVQAEAVRENAP